MLSNVALLNYVFDVPVKQLSSNLLLASIVLLVPDARRLLAIFFLNRAAQPADVSFRFPRWLQRARRFLKPIVVVGGTLVPLAISSQIAPKLRERPPLFGIYDVASFTRNKEVIAPLESDPTRWKRVIFSRPRTMTIDLMRDSLQRFSATVDTIAHRVTFWQAANPREKDVFDYERLAASALRLRGMVRGGSVEMFLERVQHDSVYRLLGGHRTR